jgi:hypothetical protein
LSVGDQVNVTLCSNPSTGISWQEPEISDAAIVSLANKTFGGRMPEAGRSLAQRALVGHDDVEDKEDDEDKRERSRGPDPGRGVDVGPAALRIAVASSSPMPAQSVDPGIDEEREHEAVEGPPMETPARNARTSSTPLTGSTRG